MNDLPAPIAGADRVTSIFGYWPSFHDAEVIDLRLHRGDIRDIGPALIAKIHAFEMTKEVSASGSYVCRHHCVVTMRFAGIEDLELDGFNHQNALMGLNISGTFSDTKAGLEVSFENAFGLDATFSCRSIEVVNVESLIPPGSVYSQQKTKGDNGAE
jgi:hypothetical protein